MSDPTKTCSKCGQKKPRKEFGRDSQARDGLAYRCRSCERERTLERNRSPERQAYWTRQWRMRTHGMDQATYDQLVFTQQGCCAICRTKPAYNLFIDHDHVTGKVRGLLCSQCNTALGMMKDDPLRLILAAEYLQQSQDPEEVSEAAD